MLYDSNLDDKALNTASQPLTALTALTSLDLGGNGLTDCSPLKPLTALKSLSLWNNKITDISPLNPLTALTSLDLSQNNLTDISPLKPLTALTRLALHRNKIKDLPEWITELGMEIYSDNSYHETGIALENNPLETPPLEIVKQGKDAIRNYFAETASGELDHLYEAKLLIVGEERAGKSSLTEALSDPNYKFQAKPSTEGIDIKQWIIPSEGEVLPRGFRLNVWDFGGQAIYHATHQFFLTKRSIYFLVTEARKEMRHDDFYYWLNIIKTLGGDSPVVMILNKCDQPTVELPVNEYRETFQIYDSLKVSCKDKYKDTIETLRRVTRQIITDKNLMPDVGTPLPRVWIDIRNDLEKRRSKGTKYLSYENDYLKICDGYGMNQDRAAYLADFFHDLGVFLHFKDDIYLKDTIFLNHEWVTKAVYNVLDNQEIIERYGQFHDSDLEKIWSEKEFKNKQPELLSLMKNRKFELCFDLPEGGYLAPNLLQGDKPNHLHLRGLDRPEALNNPLMFEFRYSFMPKGILARLIVKLHEYIYQKINWRYGVVLEYDSTKALVRELYFDRKIGIVVQGENAKELLAIIRKNISEINNGFTNLQIDEVVLCKCDKCMGLIAQKKPSHFYELANLKERIRQNIDQVECNKSFKKIKVHDLLGDIVEYVESQNEKVFPMLNVFADNASFGNGASHSHIEGDYVEGPQNKMRDNFGEAVFGDKITTNHKEKYGLSRQDFTDLIRAINQLSADQQAQLAEPIQNLRLAKTQKEKESLTKRIKAHLVSYGIGVAGSLTANGVWLLAANMLPK